MMLLRRHRRLVVTLGLLASTLCKPPAIAAQTGEGVLAGTYLDGTSRMTIHSAETGADYVVWVSVPRDYDPAKHTYPMLLMLDGRSQFALATTAARLEEDDGVITAPIIVGIATAGTTLDHEVRRLYDYIPDTVPDALKDKLHPYLHAMFLRYGMPEAGWDKIKDKPLFGGAAHFLSFVDDSLLPMLEKRYSIDRSALTIAGHSAGGAFVSYALIKGAPFSRYLIGSYTAQWYGSSLPRLEADFAKANAGRHLIVYESHGAYEPEQLHAQEDFTVSEAVLDRLASSLPGTILKHNIVPEQGHSGSVSATLAGGIRFLFMKPGAIGATSSQDHPSEK